MFFPYFNYRFSFFANHADTYYQLQCGEKIFHLFIIFWGGSVWARRIKSSDIRGHKSVSCLVAEQSFPIISCYGSKQTGLLSSAPVTRDWILMRPILELCALHSIPLRSSPPLSFFLDLNKKQNQQELQYSRSDR